MDTSFTPLSSTSVERHRLKFNTKEGFAEACRRCREKGFLNFRSGESHNLVGRLVRVHREELIIEVDAARDLDA